MNMRYAIVIEQAGTGFSAYVPDLPGCIATGSTVSEVQEQMLRAIELHLEGLRADGIPVPRSASQVAYLDVPA
jgi:predicted RNase H-like HicB family nuclease